MNIDNEIIPQAYDLIDQSVNQTYTYVYCVTFKKIVFQWTSSHTPSVGDYVEIVNEDLNKTGRYRVKQIRHFIIPTTKFRFGYKVSPIVPLTIIVVDFDEFYTIYEKTSKA
ncbi:MAG: hypothetical protein IKO36_03830 [Bacteroidaceae bacterium]|nr:hypothetical protein [Bacteroidaceae bacterium]